MSPLCCASETPSNTTSIARFAPCSLISNIRDDVTRRANAECSPSLPYGDFTAEKAGTFVALERYQMTARIENRYAEWRNTHLATSLDRIVDDNRSLLDGEICHRVNTYPSAEASSLRDAS